MPLPRVRLQQLQHHPIIRIPVPGPRPPHDPGQMQISHRHLVRRPMTALHRLRGRPRPDPRHQLQPRPGSIPTACSSRAATRTARRIVDARLLSTPARCHSHDGINAHVRGAGITYIRAGAGPGAGSPNFRTSSRHARYASSVVTFCSRIDGISDSSTSPLRVSRNLGAIRAGRRVGSPDISER